MFNGLKSLWGQSVLFPIFDFTWLLSINLAWSYLRSGKQGGEQNYSLPNTPMCILCIYWDLNSTRIHVIWSSYPIYTPTCIPETQRSVRLFRFRVTGQFSPNDSKWPWTLQGQMYTICVTSVSESQIALHFARRPTVFSFDTILRQVHQMTSKWSWTLQGHLHPIYLTSVLGSQISVRFALWPAIFELPAEK